MQEHLVRNNLSLGPNWGLRSDEVKKDSVFRDKDSDWYEFAPSLEGARGLHRGRLHATITISSLLSFHPLSLPFLYNQFLCGNGTLVYLFIYFWIEKRIRAGNRVTILLSHLTIWIGASVGEIFQYLMGTMWRATWYPAANNSAPNGPSSTSAEKERMPSSVCLPLAQKTGETKP